MQLPQQTRTDFPPPATSLENSFGAIPSSTPAFHLSSSTTFIALHNFSQAPEDVAVILDVNSTAISEEGAVAATAEFDTIFFASESQTFAQSYTQSIVDGTGTRYLGESQIFSQAIGEFQIEANTNFSFDFAGLLSLESFLGSPDTDSSSTISSISLLLIDNFSHDIVYEFSAFSSITLSDNDREITVQAVETGNSAVNNYQSQFLFDGIANSINIVFSGSFEQFFEDDTQLTLAAITQNQNCIQVPQLESSCSTFISFDSEKIFDELLNSDNKNGDGNSDINDELFEEGDEIDDGDLDDHDDAIDDELFEEDSNLSDEDLNDNDDAIDDELFDEDLEDNSGEIDDAISDEDLNDHDDAIDDVFLGSEHSGELNDEDLNDNDNEIDDAFLEDDGDKMLVGGEMSHDELLGSEDFDVSDELASRDNTTKFPSNKTQFFDDIDDEFFEDDDRMLVGGEMSDDELLSSKNCEPTETFGKEVDSIELPDNFIYGDNITTGFSLDRKQIYEEGIPADLYGNSTSDNADFISTPLMVLG